METMLNTSTNVHASDATCTFRITDYSDFATLSLEAESEGSHHTVAWFTNPEQLADLYTVLADNHHVADVMRRRAHEAIGAAVNNADTLAPGEVFEAPPVDSEGHDVAPQELRHVGTLRAMARWPYCPACGHHATSHNKPDDRGHGCSASSDDPNEPCECPALADFATATFLSGVAGGAS